MDNSESCVVVVPVYHPAPTPDERLSLASLKLLQGRYPVVFAAPEGLNPYPYVSALPDSRVEFFDRRHFSSVEAYSRLTAGLSFYLRFVRYRHMLLIQTDACLLSGDLAPWLRMPYSYFGAPWQGEDWLPAVQAYAQKRWKIKHPIHQPPVGNGGASLRRIGHFIRAAMAYNIKGRREADWLAAHRQEDVFWTQILAPALPFFTLPPTALAARFAMETQTPAEGEPLPLAVHAFRKYHPDFWVSHLEKAVS